MAYNPSEPRDERGRWTDMDASGAIKRAASDNSTNNKAIGKPPTKKGQKVKYKNPFEDEAETTYTVVDIVPSQNWAMIEANVNMNIKPRYTANIDELIVIE